MFIENKMFSMKITRIVKEKYGVNHLFAIKNMK